MYYFASPFIVKYFHSWYIRIKIINTHICTYVDLNGSFVIMQEFALRNAASCIEAAHAQRNRICKQRFVHAMLIALSVCSLWYDRAIMLTRFVYDNIAINTSSQQTEIFYLCSYLKPFWNYVQRTFRSFSLFFFSCSFCPTCKHGTPTKLLAVASVRTRLEIYKVSTSSYLII